MMSKLGEPTDRGALLRNSLGGFIRSNWPALLILVVYLGLIHPVLLVDLEGLSLWDEAAYVASGRFLLKGEWPPVANSPLVAMLYALTYLPFLTSPFWLLLSASLGRVLLIVLLWLAVLLIARRIGRLAHPLLMPGLFLVSTIPERLIVFPSDPLYAGLAGLAFWQTLAFYEEKRPSNLVLASTFLGLAALARNDGLLLFAVFVIVALGRLIRRDFSWQALAAMFSPFLLIVGGYVVFYGLATGNFSLGTLERTYDNFEAGQQAIYTGPGRLDPVVESKLEARRIFGTPDENNYSVQRAIARNPQVYLQRVLATLKRLPSGLLSAYGKRLGIPFFLLAGRGLVELIRRRQYGLMALFLLWPAPLLSGFLITIFREGHLQFPFYIIFALSAIGITAALRDLEERRGRWLWTLALLALVLYAYVDNKMAIFLGTWIMLAAFWAVALTRLHILGASNWAPVPYLLLLVAGLIVRGDFPSPRQYVLGDSAEEQAVLYMVQNFGEGTRVAAGSPGVVYLARMEYMGLTALDVPTDRTPEQFTEWMRVQNIEAVYVDFSLWGSNPGIWELLDVQIGDGLERGFVGDGGNIQVLLLIDE